MVDEDDAPGLQKPASDPSFRGTRRFEVLSCLGHGGMGLVYEVLDRERGTRVALKTLRHSSADALLRFKQEFRALADLQHANLVRLGELFETSGVWYFTMELVEGVDFLTYVRAGSAEIEEAPTLPPEQLAPTLEDPIRDADTESETREPWQTGPCLNEARLRSALAQLGRGLEALHAAGKVHRDIKPSNILVTAEERVVLLDFGLVTDATLTRDSTSTMNAAGTANYMAPEQSAGIRTGPAADWYAVGTVLYEALTGQLPFRGAPVTVLLQKQQFDPPPPSSVVTLVPHDLDTLCVDLLRRVPEERPTAVEVLARLDAARDAPMTLQRAVDDTRPQAAGAPFVGRERELAALWEAFESSLSGRSVTVCVSGESGVGKSVLVRRFLEAVAARERRAVILSGRCYERENVPYKGMDALVDSLCRFWRKLPPTDAGALLPRRASLLPMLFPVLERVPAVATAPRLPPTSDVHALRTQAFAALRDVFSCLCDRRPLVLFIDDVQWAGADSLTLLNHVMEPPDPPSLLLVTTMRTGSARAPTEDPDEPTPTPESVSAGTDVRHISLPTLPPDQARELVRLLSPSLAAERTGRAQAIAEEAGGHPLFIRELVRHLEEEAGGSAETMLLDEALWARISRLERPAGRLLEVLAVAGRPVSRLTAMRAAEISSDEYEAATALLRGAFLARMGGAPGAGAIEPYHDRVREAVLAHLDSDTRKRHHGWLANALERAGAATSDPHLLVRHLAAAGEAKRAARYAAEAGRNAARALAFEQAAELFQTALRLGDHDEEGARQIRLDLGAALVNAGRGVEAAEVLVLAARGADPETRLQCRRQAAEQLLISGHIESGLEAIGKLLAEIEVSLPATPRRAFASLLWHRFKLRLRGLRWNERPAEEIDAGDLTRLDVYKAVSDGLAVVDNIRGADFQARGMLLALRVGEPIRVGRAIALEACFLATQGGRGLERARGLVDETRRMATQRDDPYLHCIAAFAHGLVCFFDGRFSTAARALEESENGFRDRTTGTTWELNQSRMFRFFALRCMGSFVQTRVLLEEYVRDATRRGDRYAATTSTRFCSLVRLVQDGPTEARRALDSASWLPPLDRFHLQHWWELEASGQLALYEGSAPSAIDELAPSFDGLERSLILRVQIVRSFARSLRAGLLLADAETASPRALAEAARTARQLEREKVGFAEVFALLLRAGIAERKGAPEVATARLRDVALAAARHDMLFQAAAARWLLGQRLGDGEGQELFAEANEWMTEERIADPARAVAIVAPGLA